jgi:hypothetical protein
MAITPMISKYAPCVRVLVKLAQAPRLAPVASPSLIFRIFTTGGAMVVAIQDFAPSTTSAKLAMLRSSLHLLSRQILLQSVQPQAYASLQLFSRHWKHIKAAIASHSWCHHQVSSALRHL